jgi:hypothetical protein
VKAMGGTFYELDGVLIQVYPERNRLNVSMHRLATWEQVPTCLWPHARIAHSRGGMFLSEEDRRSMGPHWQELLGPAPPPLQ